MDPMMMAMLVGAGLGAIQSHEEKNMWANQQKAEAEKTRYAPWTGQWGSNLAPPAGDLAHIGAGAMTGAAIGQQMDTNADTKLTDDAPSEGFYTKNQKYSLLGNDTSNSPSYSLMNDEAPQRGSYRLFDDDASMFGNGGNPYADQNRYQMMLRNY